MPNSITDPFNYRIPKREDCMSLNTITFDKDRTRQSTKRFHTVREDS